MSLVLRKSLIFLTIFVAVFATIILIYINSPTRIGDTSFSLEWNDQNGRRVLVWNETRIVVPEYCDEVFWNEKWLVFHTWKNNEPFN